MNDETIIYQQLLVCFERPRSVNDISVRDNLVNARLVVCVKVSSVHFGLICTTIIKFFQDKIRVLNWPD